MPETPRPGQALGRIGANSAEGFHCCISQLHCEGLEDPSLRRFAFFSILHSLHRSTCPPRAGSAGTKNGRCN